MRLVLLIIGALWVLPARAGVVIIGTNPPKVIQPAPPVGKGVRGALIIKPHP